MDPRLDTIIRGLIGAGRSRRKTATARAMAKATEGIPLGHSYLPIAVDQEAAREYDSRAKQWIALVTRAVTGAGFTWTSDRAIEVGHLLRTELLVDWEELIGLIRSKTKARGDGRMQELDAANDRVQAEFPHELDLLVLAQDRSRVPIDEQLAAPRYAAVCLAWKKATDLLNASQPDFPNAAKDAVAAVEQLARVVTAMPSATLGDAIKVLRGSGRIQAPLLKGIEEIWGWASDTPSVRHGASATLVVDGTAARYIAAQSEAAIALLLSTDLTSA